MYAILTGSGGLSVARQLYNRFDAAGKLLKAADIAIVAALTPLCHQSDFPISTWNAPMVHNLVKMYSSDV